MSFSHNTKIGVHLTTSQLSFLSSVRITHQKQSEISACLTSTYFA